LREERREKREKWKREERKEKRENRKREKRKEKTFTYYLLP
jgi:hypothetical protein